MDRGNTGIFVVPWSQTSIDGLRSAPPARLESGAGWSWQGDAVALASASNEIATTDPSELQRYALRALPRLLGRQVPSAGLTITGEPAVFDRTFTVADGCRRYTLTMVDLAELARPLLLVLGDLPPRGRPLQIVDTAGLGLGRSEAVNRVTEEPTGVICFTPGTRLMTPHGPRLVEDLTEGDKVSTKDDGAQDILWIGSRRMSGARLHAMPELRPIRLRGGAIDGEIPAPDLVVSPKHRIVLTGRIAQALFGTPEVLVTARDLADDRGILMDRSITEVTYVHILLARHQIVWANGVETESFHPASTDLLTIGDDQRARLFDIAPHLESDPSTYGAPARKALTAEEASIFASERPTRH